MKSVHEPAGFFTTFRLFSILQLIFKFYTNKRNKRNLVTN